MDYLKESQSIILAWGLTFNFIPVIKASIEPADSAVLNNALSRIHLAKVTMMVIQKIKKPGAEKNNEKKKIIIISPAHSDGCCSVMDKKMPHKNPFMNAESIHTVKVINVILM